MEKSNEGFVSSVLQELTFTEQYFRWDLFGSTKRKTNLVETLVHQALMICLKSKLQHELKNISSILRNNGYPETTIQKPPCLRKLHFLIANQKKDNKKVQLTLSSLGLANFL